MDSYAPIPPKLVMEMKIMQHDLHQLRANVAAGRVRPEHYAMLERVMSARLELIEAAIHDRLLHEARAQRIRTN